MPDHYVFRMLCSQGVPLDDLGVPRVDGGPVETDGRTIWRRFAENYHLFRGTPTRLWLDHTLRDRVRPDRRGCRRETADAAYDHIADCLARPEFRPRALFERFNIEVIATTDSPLDDLRWHRMIRESGWKGTGRHRLSPGFGGRSRSFAGFAANVERLRRADRLRHRRPGTAISRRTAVRRAFFKALRRDQHRPRPPDRPHGEPVAGRGRGPVRPGALRPVHARRRPSCSAGRC